LPKGWRQFMRTNNATSGDIFVITAPSGTGKTTLVRLLLSSLPNLVFSISYTTRPPRPNEIHGKDYFFVTKDKFKKMIAAGEMIEWAEVYGNYYGTAASFLQQTIEKGKDILLDIDIQGAKQVKQYFPQAVLIFLLPPSLEELERRLKKRATDPIEVIQKRLAAARREISAAKEFDYIVVNDILENALEELKAIILATKAKAEKRWKYVCNFLSCL